VLAQEGIPGLETWILIFGSAVCICTAPVVGLLVWAFRKAKRTEWDDGRESTVERSRSILEKP
jgi:hypothetical protein